jgi:hypothetical protein
MAWSHDDDGGGGGNGVAKLPNVLNFVFVLFPVECRPVQRAHGMILHHMGCSGTDGLCQGPVMERHVDPLRETVFFCFSAPTRIVGNGHGRLSN